MKGGMSSLPLRTLGLVGNMGGLFAPGLGVLTAALGLWSPKLLRLGRPGQLTSIKGSDIGTELLEAVEDGGETLLA